MEQWQMSFPDDATIEKSQQNATFCWFLRVSVMANVDFEKVDSQLVKVKFLKSGNLWSFKSSQREVSPFFILQLQITNKSE